MPWAIASAIDPFSGVPCGGGCSTEAINAACEIWKLHTEGKIYLKPDHFNPLGNDPYDGASARDNIKDTCEGKQVRRLWPFWPRIRPLVNLMIAFSIMGQLKPYIL